MSSFQVLAYALIEHSESLLGVAEAAWGKVFAYYDAAISSVTNSIARFQHRTNYWHGVLY